MGRIYSPTTGVLAVTGQSEQLRLDAGASSTLKVWALIMSAQNVTSGQDIAAMPFKVKLANGHTPGAGTPIAAAGIGRSPVTIANPNFTATAAAADSTGGTILDVYESAFNLAAQEKEFVWTPETVPILNPSDAIIVEVLSVPVASVDLSIQLFVEES